jgi:threonine dehydrogenase-like Zn-dependent dehydrogenase
MLGVLLRILAEGGAQAMWVLVFCAGVIGLFVLICAVAAMVVIFTSNVEQRKWCYRIFQDLLRFFGRGQDT